MLIVSTSHCENQTLSMLTSEHHHLKERCVQDYLGTPKVLEENINVLR